MWILSQDKQMLVNTNALYINEECEGKGFDREYHYEIQCPEQIGIRKLGVYSTKDKALKVLTDIQDEIEINNSIMPNVIEGKRGKIYKVFQMPQDNEVE